MQLSMATHLDNCLKVVSATYLLVRFLCLKETRKNVLYFALKALFDFEIIKF